MRHPEDFVRAAWGRIGRLTQQVIPGTALGETIDIDHLICPLRFDICVRMKFVQLIRDDRELYSSDIEAFLARPEARAYYSWFRNVRSVRYEPSLLRNPERMQSAFLRRVAETASLWDSLSTYGFDEAKPVRLSSGRSIRNVHGKAIDERVFSGDGCHRIACLRLLGWKRLEPTHYEVLIRPRFEPLDITAELIEIGTLDRETFLRFVCRFYGDGHDFESTAALERYVAKHKPKLLAELRSVLRYDLVKLNSQERIDANE